MHAMLRLGTLALALLGCATAAQAASTIYTRSYVCSRAIGGDTCEQAAGYGSSSISRNNTFVPPPGSPYPDSGWNYTAEARVAADAASFGAFAQASGSSLGTPIAGPLGMSGTAQVEYHDELTIAGAGPGFIVVPWHLTGAFDVFAVSGGAYGTPGGSIGTSFCQSILVGANTGGRGCTGGAQDVVHASGPYDRVLLLEYAIDFGVAYSLNTTFSLNATSGAGLTVGITSDFSHTGTQQAALVYDANHNLVLNPEITAASGVDYLNPQASVVPAPPAIWLLATGLVGLGGRRCRQRMVAA
jgi:hypothetical protein